MALCFEIYKHAENQYSKLTQTDFTLIVYKLRAHKLASQTYTALASLHRDFHATMQDAGLVTHVQMHARNQSITSQALHYFPALAAHIPATPLPVVPALGVDAVAALQARVAQLVKVMLR